jgi:predicted GTPase
MTEKSILERIEPIKKRIRELCSEAEKDKIINDKEYSELINKIEKEKIKIGIIGQIKSGKSTLLNALIFADNILPVASTPMTASLTYLTYCDSKEPSAEVEFYSKEDWKDIEELAKNTDTDTYDERVKAAKELVEKLEKNKDVKAQILSLLGKKKKIRFEELKDYAGEEGKYVPITKAITIYYPHDRLKEVDLVDTPGFNDPVLSREERANEFFEEADVVIFLIYAGRPFDKTDREIVFDKIRTAGVGKVIVVLNKSDIIFEQEGNLEKAEKYVKEKFNEEVNKFAEEHPTSAKIFREAKIISFSSLWALLGRVDEDAIKRDEILKWYYENHKKNFPFLKKKEDFLKYSKLDEFENAMEEILKKGKLNVLISKTLSSLTGKYDERLGDFREDLQKLRIEGKALAKKLEEIEEERKKLEEIEKEMKAFIGNKIIDIKEWISKKEIYSEVRHLLYGCRNSIRFPEKSFFHWHTSYSSMCSAIANDKLSECKYEIEKKVEKFSEMVFEKMRELVDDIQNEAINQSRYLNFTYEDYEKLMGELLKLFDTKIEFSFRFGLRIKTSGWWFMGTGRAKEEAIEQLSDHIESLWQKCKTKLDEIMQEIIGNKLDWLRENFSRRVIAPIYDSLKNAERNYREKKKRLKEIESNESEQRKKIEEIEKKKKSLEIEAQNLLEGKV